MAEEAGYEIKRSDLKYLGNSFGTKSSDTVYYLYTVDLTGKQKTLEADGDGSELERMAECYWDDKIDAADDPLVYVLYHKLLQSLKK
jgi:hypothetical protein